MNTSPELESFRQSILHEDLDAMRRAIAANSNLVSSHVTEYRRAFCFACERGRLAAAKLLVELGADPREDGDFAVTRTSLHHPEILRWLMDEFDIDPNMVTGDNWGPLILCPCETLNPGCLEVLLERGADPNLIVPGANQQGTAMDMVFNTYSRSSSARLDCFRALLEQGGRLSEHIDPVALNLHLGQHKELQERLSADPTLANRRIDHPNGNTANRWLPLNGGTLLHVACEWPDEVAVNLLLEHGADPNAVTEVDEKGFGGQTPLFHALSQYRFEPIVEILLNAGADPSRAARLTGNSQWLPRDTPMIVEGTAIEYARVYPGDGHGAQEGSLDAKEALLARPCWTAQRE